MTSQSQQLIPHHVFGVSSSLGKHIILVREVDEGRTYRKLLYISGRYIAKLNLSKESRYFVYNHEKIGAFSCLTVHDNIVYVAEKGNNATISLCNIHDFKVVGSLEGRSNAGYSCLDVRKDGQLLCGITIDCSLTLWDLDQMQILLQTKAFGENMVHVAFSEFDNDLMITKGKNHFKMWKLENTFTGLKLKRKSWNFGDINIYNISCYLQFQSGRMITGTDEGLLLLWEENNAKRSFSQYKDKICNDSDSSRIEKMIPLHDGCIDFLYYDENNQKIITSGSDGMLKWWQSDAFFGNGGTEINSKSINFKVTPTRIVALRKYDIRSINFFAPFEENHFIIKDCNGKLFKLNLVNDSLVLYVDFHEGNINAMDVSPEENLCATSGRDGKIYCIQFAEKKILSTILLASECTCITWSPVARTFVCGFAHGGIKIMQLINLNIEVTQSFQPFKSKVTLIRFHSSNSLLASCDDAGQIFLFEYDIIHDDGEIKVSPIGFIQCDGLLTRSFSWRQDEAFDYKTGNGRYYSIDLSNELCKIKKANDCRKRTTYKLDVHKLLIKTMSKEYQNDEKIACQQLSKWSFDGQFFLESSQDGILSIWTCSSDKDPQFSPIQTPLRLFGHEECFPVKSFSDDDAVPSLHLIRHEVHPTLEEELIQQQLESKQQIVFRKRKRIYDSILGLRTQMLSIRKLNSSLDPHHRLPSSSYFLHPFLSSIYNEIEEEELRKVNLNDMELKEIRNKHEMLQATFLDDLEEEYLRESSFHTDEILSSVKVTRRDNYRIQLQMIQKQAAKVAKTPDGKIDQPFYRDESPVFEANDTQPQEVNTAMNRKELRKKRNKMIDEKTEEYNLLQSFHFSDNNLGEKAFNNDCKQKGINNIGSLNKTHMNVEKKIDEIIFWEKFVYNSKRSYNSKVDALKKRKLKLIKMMESKDTRLNEIHSELNGCFSPACYSAILKVNCSLVLPQLVQFQSNTNSPNLKYDEVAEIRLLLEFEKAKLLKEKSKFGANFDTDFNDLLRDCFDMILSTKLNEMRLNNLMLELCMLLGFEDSGKALRSRFESCNESHTKIVDTLNMYELKLRDNKEYLHSTSMERNRILEEFDVLVPLTSQMREDLFKIFMRGQNNPSNVLCENDSFDQIFLSESEDEEEICPDSCPTHLFTDMINLRERRHSIENEQKRLFLLEGKLQRSYELFHSKLLQSEKIVEENRSKIQEFELDKQNQLNDTLVTSAITTKQIFLWEDGNHPTFNIRNNNKFLIIPSQKLIQLMQRSWNICDEIKVGRSNLVKLSGEMNKKSKNCKALQDLIILEKQKCQELQLLKFGQKVDIVAFDKLSDKMVHTLKSSAAKELKSVLITKENEIKYAEVAVSELKLKLKEVLNKNTSILNCIAKSSQQQQQFNFNKMDKGAKKIDNNNSASELLQLKMTSLKQRKEIEELRKSIGLLKRKDGYIYGNKI